MVTLEEITSLDEYFQSLIDLIPNNIYGSPENESNEVKGVGKSKKRKFVEPLVNRNVELKQKLEEKMQVLKGSRGGKHLSKLEKTKLSFEKGIEIKRLKREKKKLKLIEKKSASKVQKKDDDNKQEKKIEDNFLFSTSTEVKIPKEKKKFSNRDVNGMKKQLVEATKEKKRLEELKEGGDVKNLVSAEDTEWNNLMQKAVGDNDRSKDPKFLKKRIKQLEKSKEKSTKKWKAREKAQKSDKNDRIDKRNANIENKRKEKVARKLRMKGISVSPGN